EIVAKWASGAVNQLPALAEQEAFVAEGGLMSFTPNAIDQFRQASRVCRPYPQGREARRPAGAGADEIRPVDQPEDREDTGPRGAAYATRPCRRGHRVSQTSAVNCCTCSGLLLARSVSTVSACP